MIKETTQQLLARMATEIAENEQKVFVAGYEKGQEEADTSDAYNEGYEVGLEQGKQAEYDAFWDTLQQNGNRTNYNWGFYGKGWTDDNFKPKYFNVNMARGMFEDTKLVKSDYLKRLDFSKCASFIQTFYNSTVEEVGIIDMSSMTRGHGCANMFLSCKSLRKIEKLIPPKEGIFNGSFNQCSALEDITIEGVIVSNGLDFQHSTKLSRASIESILAHLDDVYHGEARSVTFSKAAVDKAFETSEGANDGSTDTLYWLPWMIAVGEDYGKWTISLV